MTEPPTSDGAKNRSASRHRDWSSTDDPAYPMKAAPSSSNRYISASQAKKAKLLYSLHAGPVAFVVANLFNAGSARIVAGLGFETAATSSGGFAATLGRKDGRITHAEALSDARAVLEPTDLPTSAGLESGFGNTPEAITETVRGAAQAGLVGFTFKGATKDKDQPIYLFDTTLERI